MNKHKRISSLLVVLFLSLTCSLIYAENRIIDKNHEEQEGQKTYKQKGWYFSGNLGFAHFFHEGGYEARYHSVKEPYNDLGPYGPQAIIPHIQNDLWVDVEAKYYFNKWFGMGLKYSYSVFGIEAGLDQLAGYISPVFYFRCASRDFKHIFHCNLSPSRFPISADATELPIFYIGYSGLELGYDYRINQHFFLGGRISASGFSYLSPVVVSDGICMFSSSFSLTYHL